MNYNHILSPTPSSCVPTTQSIATSTCWLGFFFFFHGREREKERGRERERGRNLEDSWRGISVGTCFSQS